MVQQAPIVFFSFDQGGLHGGIEDDGEIERKSSRS